MLGSTKFISRVEQDISLVRFAHSWDIPVNTRNKFHISPHHVLFSIYYVSASQCFVSFFVFFPVSFYFLYFRYGIGMIYYKQEKYNLAEVHFKKALTINPSSSVLLCHIGVVGIYRFELTRSLFNWSFCCFFFVVNILKIY